MGMGQNKVQMVLGYTFKNISNFLIMYELKLGIFYSMSILID